MICQVQTLDDVGLFESPLHVFHAKIALTIHLLGECVNLAQSIVSNAG